MQETELNRLKWQLYSTAEISKHPGLREVNRLIAAANRDAYDKLDRRDKANVTEAVRDLQARINGQFGEASALELLAAVGDVLNCEAEKEARRCDASF
jgi:hypothetical protein